MSKKLQAIAAPIFKRYPAVTTVFVVGTYGFITQNSAKLYAQGKKKIHAVTREQSDPQPEMTNVFEGLTKAQLIEQGSLRGMELSDNDIKAVLIEQLQAYDAKLTRESDPNKD